MTFAPLLSLSLSSRPLSFFLSLHASQIKSIFFFGFKWLPLPLPLLKCLTLIERTAALLLLLFPSLSLSLSFHFFDVYSCWPQLMNTHTHRQTYFSSPSAKDHNFCPVPRSESSGPAAKHFCCCCCCHLSSFFQQTHCFLADRKALPKKRAFHVYSTLFWAAVLCWLLVLFMFFGHFFPFGTSVFTLHSFILALGVCLHPFWGDY